MAGLPRTSKGLKSVVKPKVDDILNRFDRSTITHGYGPHNVPDHNNLRCYDFMVPNIAKGNRVADYIIANRKILGINGIIWNRRVYRMGGTYTGGPANQWGLYRGPSPHTDHLHVEFNEQPLRAVAQGNSEPNEKDHEMTGEERAKLVNDIVHAVWAKNSGSDKNNKGVVQTMGMNSQDTNLAIKRMEAEIRSLRRTVEYLKASSNTQ